MADTLKHLQQRQQGITPLGTCKQHMLQLLCSSGPLVPKLNAQLAACASIYQTLIISAYNNH